VGKLEELIQVNVGKFFNNFAGTYLSTRAPNMAFSTRVDNPLA